MTEDQQKELKKEYDNLDVITLNEKVREAMMVIVTTPEESKEDGFPLYEHVHENFNHSQLVHLACTFIAKEMIDKLKDSSEFLETVRMLRFLNKMQQKK